MTSDTEITPETSNGICTHMNIDHAATLHAMALSSLSNQDAFRCKVQNVKMQSVTMKEYTLSFTVCDGDACAMKDITIPFIPALTSSNEVRKRLIEDHHRALSPKLSWLITDPIMRLLFGACLLLGVGTALGQDEVSTKIDNTPWANTIVTSIFGSSTLFAKLVVISWYFSLIAHTMEAFYTAYLCKTVLKTKMGTTIKWFLLNVAVGYPIMNKVRELVNVDNAARTKKKSK